MVNEDLPHSIGDDIRTFVKYFIIYLYQRLRLLFLYIYAVFIWLFVFIGSIKNSLVQRMFWGRSVFYRSAFQFIVGLLTLVLSLGGFVSRLNILGSNENQVFAYSDQAGDADYLDESASIQAIVTNASRSRDFEVQKYIVLKGDTIVSIADKFGVSADTIKWANNLKGDSPLLKVGQELDILPINGVVIKVVKGDSIASIAKKYEATTQDIYDINWLDSNILKEGQELLVPNGKMPQPKPINPPVIASKPGQNTSQLLVIPKGNGIATGSFIRPAGCGILTNHYSSWHRAVDIGTTGNGCPNVAVDGGVVTRARWMGNGGLQIEIDHGNGFYSLYAHNDVIYVKEGDTVSKGQPIGWMGVTGHVTGRHIHFGLRLNGIWINPVSYIPI